MSLQKFIKRTVRECINEELTRGKNITAYHGTRSIFPFQSFDDTMIGTGLVSRGGADYKGFFFTTEPDNAEFYAEYFVCKVSINNVLNNPTDSKHPTTILKAALTAKENYIIEDVLDGAYHSDIIVVPKNNLNTINILDWEFLGDKDGIFEKWDEAFGGGEEVDTDMIDETLEIINLDKDFLMSIPIFKSYYESK